MDTQFKVAIGQFLDMNRIVQVFSFLTVNSKGDFIPQVQATFKIALGRGIRNSFCLGHDGFWKFRNNVHGFQHFQHINPDIVLVADNIRHMGNKIIVVASRILINLNLENLGPI